MIAAVAAQLHFQESVAHFAEPSFKPKPKPKPPSPQAPKPPSPQASKSPSPPLNALLRARPAG